MSLSSHFASRRHAACACAVAGSFLASSASAQLVIGGFDTSRSGCAAIDQGSCFDSVRSFVSGGFPDAVFVGTPALTPEFLDGVDVVLLASGTGNPWPQMASVSASPSSRVTNGPFGSVSSWTIGWTGWFTSVPPFATVDATVVQSGQPGLLSIPRHALAACSGPVILFADTTTLSDGFLAEGTGSPTLLLNAIAWATEDACAAGVCGDIDGDGSVSASDLALLLGAWGGSGSADLDASGSVDASDLAILLGAWGAC